MQGVGLAGVANPSALFLADRSERASGSVVFAGLEGHDLSWLKFRPWCHLSLRNPAAYSCGVGWYPAIDDSCRS